jgi:dihydropteroate synthase
MVWWGVLTGARALLGSVAVGVDAPVAVMGALNVSPESFYAGSVHHRPDDLLAAAASMVEAGATLLDVGARSTAPYRATDVDEAAEADRLGRAVGLLVAKVSVPISADTARPAPAARALEAGAAILNDQSGLADTRLAELARDRGASVILMASPAGSEPMAHAREPVAEVRVRLQTILDRARRARIPDERIVLDPGIGFFRDAAVPWDVWDTTVLAGLHALTGLGRPLCVGVSRKSFLGALTGHHDPSQRLAGSLAATAVAVVNGAAVIRTHDVAQTRDAVRVAERLRPLGRS